MAEMKFVDLLLPGIAFACPSEPVAPCHVRLVPFGARMRDDFPAVIGAPTGGTANAAPPGWISFGRALSASARQHRA